jgi:hypothetical protein
MQSFLHELGVFGNRVKVHFRHHVIINSEKEASFWVALSFLMTFGSVRFITTRIRQQNLASQKRPHAGAQQRRLGLHDIVLPGGLHIHHAVPGIFLSLTAGYLALITEKKSTRKLSVMYGMGSALALDEFALWLELRDVYWAKEGRLSFDAVAAAGALFMGGYALSEFGGAILRDLHIRATTGAYPAHHAELDDKASAGAEHDAPVPSMA